MLVKKGQNNEISDLYIKIRVYIHQDSYVYIRICIYASRFIHINQDSYLYIKICLNTSRSVYIH